jgi:hypothetical protein
LEKIWAIGILFGISLYGFVQIAIRFRLYTKKYEYGINFLENLRTYWESAGSDMETYGWMIYRSNRIQGDMGQHGIISQYRPPHQNYIITNYPIILNMLPELRRSLEDDLLARRLAPEYANALQESLVRYLGSLEDKQKLSSSEMKNPIKWFREGVRNLMAVPLYIVGWLGVVSDRSVRRWTTSAGFKYLSGLVGLLGLVSGIMTIVLGWDAFIDVARGTLS